MSWGNDVLDHIIKGKHESLMFPSGIERLEEFLKVFETCVISEAFYEYILKSWLLRNFGFVLILIFA